MKKELFEQINKEMQKQYEQIYNFEAKYPKRRIKGYGIALEYWSNFAKEYNRLLTDFVEMRKDYITSDRECVVFLFALEKLGLWG